MLMNRLTIRPSLVTALLFLVKLLKHNDTNNLLNLS